MNRIFYPAALILFFSVLCNISTAARIDKEDVIKYVSGYNITAIKELGPDVMPVLSNLYKISDQKQKQVIANIFYQLGIESRDAKDGLMQDIRTDNQQLRISVQYALGRVSSDKDVVDALLYNMHNDNNAYFRDKAACALAYDQIHLTDREKVQLYEGLIKGLSSSNRQIRDIAIKALQIHTGQTKGYHANVTAIAQSESIRKWHEWLEEYKSNL